MGMGSKPPSELASIAIPKLVCYDPELRSGVQREHLARKRDSRLELIIRHCHCVGGAKSSLKRFHGNTKFSCDRLQSQIEVTMVGIDQAAHNLSRRIRRARYQAGRKVVPIGPNCGDRFLLLVPECRSFSPFHEVPLVSQTHQCFLISMLGLTLDSGSIPRHAPPRHGGNLRAVTSCIRALIDSGEMRPNTVTVTGKTCMTKPSIE